MRKEEKKSKMEEGADTREKRESGITTGYDVTKNPMFCLQEAIRTILKCLGFESSKPDHPSSSSSSSSMSNDTKKEEENNIIEEQSEQQKCVFQQDDGQGNQKQDDDPPAEVDDPPPVVRLFFPSLN